MTDPISEFLAGRGAPEHLVKGGAEGLMSRWHDFVERAEAGYSFGLEDYRNDLDLRSLIELAGIGPAVASDDARLRKLLTHTDVELWSSDVEGAWWVRGYPRNSGALLMEDLADEDLTQI